MAPVVSPESDHLISQVVPVTQIAQMPQKIEDHTFEKLSTQDVKHE